MRAYRCSGIAVAIGRVVDELCEQRCDRCRLKHGVNVVVNSEADWIRAD